MSSRRLQKAAAAIREVVSMAILAELNDPRVKHVTVIGVQVAPDMRQAKVLVSIMGDEKQQKLSLRGLQNAAGFLQSRIADKIDTRYTPKLEFVLDQGVKKSLEMARILHEVLPPTEKAVIEDDSDVEEDEVGGDAVAPADARAEQKEVNREGAARPATAGKEGTEEAEQQTEQSVAEDGRPARVNDP
jgi:ribosome-binding factor A